MTHSNDSTTLEIILPKGEIVLIDAADWERVKHLKWYPRRCKHTTYVIHQDRSQWPWRTILLHRLILDAPHGVNVDHENHNGLDNRRCNIRLATSAQNGANRSPSKGREGMKGVTFHRQTRKWEARIYPNGTSVYLGLHSTIKEAADAYDEAAIRFFGEFAHLNSYDEDAA